MEDGVSRETPPASAPPPPAVAAEVFGDALPAARRYADLLATEATLRGLIGPREVPRLWERHLLNCAVVADLVPEGASVCDVGSGAGLPGLPLAIRRPDLQITLVEPLLRRSTFLDEVVHTMGLTNIEVQRGRAEDVQGQREFEVVTSRAVAPLDRLARWSLPLARRGGVVLAMKGASAAEEVERTADAVRRAGGGPAEVLTVGARWLDPPVTVVRIPRVSDTAGGAGRSRTKRKKRG